MSIKPKIAVHGRLEHIMKLARKCTAKVMAKAEYARIVETSDVWMKYLILQSITPPEQVGQDWDYMARNWGRDDDGLLREFIKMEEADVLEGFFAWRPKGGLGEQLEDLIRQLFA